jgi:hypothetical protein
VLRELRQKIQRRENLKIPLRPRRQPFPARITLHISYETVKEHVQHILRKIGVSDRTQAAVWAMRKELV